MAGRYKVDKVYSEDSMMSPKVQRRSSHKTLDDAVLQSTRMLKADVSIVIAYNIMLDGVLIQTVRREETNEA